MISENGVIYCVTGSEHFLKEAYLSIKSLKRVDKDIKISIFIDNGNLDRLKKEYFDSVHLIKNPEFGFGDKIYSMRNSPYSKTLYLDCDTFITAKFDEIFSMLNDYDVGVINVPFKNSNYPHFNAGIIAFRKSERTTYFLEQWDEKWDRKDIDQGIFQHLLDLVSYFVLPPEYNFRMPFVSYAMRKIKIIHWHELIKLGRKDRTSILNQINKFQTERLWFPHKGIVVIDSHKNLITRSLIFIERFIYDKMKIDPESLKVLEKIRKKLLRYELKWFLDWILPYYYRAKMKNTYRNIMKYQ
jgi:hypothetical protein